MERRLEDLKQKYQSVLRTIEQQQIRVQNLHVQDNKLFIKGNRGRDTLAGEENTALYVRVMGVVLSQKTNVRCPYKGETLGQHQRMGIQASEDHPHKAY